MKIIKLVMQAAEPLVITNGSAESMAHECLPYIPGNKLLGAFAANWRKLWPDKPTDDDPLFQDLFLNGKTRWGHACPLLGNASSVPIPKSFQRIKNHPSLPVFGNNENQAHYHVFNLVAINEGAVLKDIWQKNVEDSDEQIKLKKMPQGFMDPGTLHLAPEQHLWNIHVALGQQRSAVEGQLYAYSALAPGLQFVSEIECDDDAACGRLLELLKNDLPVRVGHARSAGYGLLNIRFGLKDCNPNPTLEEQVFTLFLESAYLPAPEWENPVKNLLNALTKLTGAHPVLEKIFATQSELQGFNSLWLRPRQTRTCLDAGSVLRIKFEKKISLHKYLRLGADIHEGYGRIVCNPPFLADPLVSPKQDNALHTSPTPELSPVTSSPLWNVLGNRIASRAALQQAEKWLYSEPWQKFLSDAAHLSQPTANQRSNLRNTTVDIFKASRSKTPREQWANPVFSPFTNSRDAIGNVVEKILDYKSYGREPLATQADLLQLPPAAHKSSQSGKPNAATTLFIVRARKLFIEHLLKLWNQQQRANASQEEHNG